MASLKELSQDQSKSAMLLKDVVEEGVYFLEEAYNEAIALAAAA